MSYTTDFEGSFKITPSLKDEHKAYLLAFSEKRRMKRYVKECAKFKDPIREAVKLPIGKQGEYTVFGEGFAGQDEDSSILDFNKPPITQPGNWCQWIPSEDGTELKIDGTGYFRDYIEWLNYLQVNFFEPWGYVLSGSVSFQGEDNVDNGVITLNDKIIPDEEYSNIKISKKRKKKQTA